MSAGNDNINALVSDGLQYKLRVDLMDFSLNTRYALYDNFKMGPASTNYILSSIGSYSGTAGKINGGCVKCRLNVRDMISEVLHGAAMYNVPASS